jgi:ABC-type multidrug transport system permease subunit
MVAIKNVEKYEWLVYLFDGVTLVFVGLFLIGTLFGASQTERTLPTMVASLACLVMSIYFFAEAMFAAIRRNLC